MEGCCDCCLVRTKGYTYDQALTSEIVQQQQAMMLELLYMFSMTIARLLSVFTIESYYIYIDRLTRVSSPEECYDIPLFRDMDVGVTVE